MKRILIQVFVFISGLLFLGSSAPELTFETLFEEFDYRVSFYSLVKLDEEDFETINAGNFYIISAPKEKEKELEAKIDGVLGKSYKFESTGFDLDKFISKYEFNIKITQYLENSKILYLYSNRLICEKIINGEMINLQIAIKDGFVVAGSPVILGSY